jgi:diguanylate cyclase (GGDEF)-like protein/PAS domain S-box-containing protein
MAKDQEKSQSEPGFETAIQQENSLLRDQIESLRDQHDLLLEEFGRIQNEELNLREEFLQKSLYLDAVLNSEIDFHFKDRHGRFILVSRGTSKKLAGPNSDQRDLTGKTDFDFFDKECAERFRLDDMAIIRDRRMIQREDTESYLGGRRKHVMIVKGPVSDPAGRVIGTYGITRDITDLTSLRRQIEAILNTSSDAIIMINGDGSTVLANPAVQTMFGHSPSELLGNSFGDLISPAGTVDGFWDRVPEGNSSAPQASGQTLEGFAKKKSGARFPVEMTISSVELDSQWFRVAIIRDITERKEAERQLQDLAERDGLTGLYNQSVFPRKLDKALAKAEPGKYAVIVADLNRFKPVNDRYGHGVGDQVLAAVARRICDSVKKHDLTGRLGGDEFSIGMDLRSVPSAEAVASLMESRIREIKVRLARPYRVYDPADGSSLLVENVGISLGYALFTPALNNAKDLLRMADQRMYEDKVRGRVER